MEFKKKPKNQFNNSELNNRSGDWLEDDEWKSLADKVKRQAAEDVARNRFHRAPRQVSHEPATDPDKVELNIKLNMPRFDVSKFKRRSTRFINGILFVPRKIVNSSFTQKLAFVALAGLIWGGYYGFTHYIKKDNTAEVQGTNTAAANSSEDIVPSSTPLFDVVLPRGREIPMSQVHFDAKRKFAKYDDEINTTKITVTQQPLPDSFKNAPEDNVKRIAADFAATEVLTFDNQNMYYGMSEKGPQTVILTKKGLLIFINTTKTVEKESLETYAYNLD